MISLIIVALIGIGSYNMGVSNQLEKDAPIIHDNVVAYINNHNDSLLAIKDIRDVVNANFSKLKGDKHIETILNDWEKKIK